MDSYEGSVGRIIGHLGGIAPTSFPRLAHSYKTAPRLRTPPLQRGIYFASTSSGPGCMRLNRGRRAMICAARAS